MAGAPVTDQEIIETLIAIRDTKTYGEAAALRGVHKNTITRHVAAAKARGITLEAAQAKAATESRAAARDREFWRKRAEDLERELAAVEHIARELAGVVPKGIQIPPWPAQKVDAKRGRSVIGMLLSDVHMGEVISPDELNGINRFDEEVCKQRVKRFFEAACIVGARWASDTDCQGALLALGGDLLSGDIHEELARTNNLTSTEQVLAVAELVAWGIELLLETYQRVHVVSVPGNHGRTTVKSTAKLYSRLSYDTMIADIVAKRFAGEPRVTFQYGPAKDQLIPIFGRLVYLTHGDKIGTKGGMGFAGPNLPIVRGTKKLEAQQARFGRRPDLILMGHYHTASNPGGVLANGSVPGYGEYADDIRAEPEPPQQWLFLLHDKWFLRERATIRLDEPGPIEMPRVKVPAVMRDA